MMVRAAIFILATLSVFTSGRSVPHGRDPAKLECEVLEISPPSSTSLKALAPIRYAIVRHKHPGDRERLSAWLRAHSGSEVSFAAADARPHAGVLWRLRMCFGRGLLIFDGPVELKEGGTIVIEFPSRRPARP